MNAQEIVPKSVVNPGGLANPMTQNNVVPTQQNTNTNVDVPIQHGNPATIPTSIAVQQNNPAVPGNNQKDDEQHDQGGYPTVLLIIFVFGLLLFFHVPGGEDDSSSCSSDNDSDSD